MNTKVFERETPALFEDDGEIVKAFEEVMQLIAQSRSESQYAKLSKLWGEVARTKDLVRKGQAPSQDDLQSSIAAEQDACKWMESALKTARDTNKEVLHGVKVKEMGLVSVLDSENDARLGVPNNDGEQMQQLGLILLEFHQGLLRDKKRLESKLALIEANRI